MWGAIAGSLFSSAINNMYAENMQEDSQSFNAEMMANAQSFNSAEAAKQRDYQTQMSNTAHQREVADLNAAGLNPMLSMMRSGATTPSGGQAMSGQASSGIASPSRLVDIPGAMQTASNINLQEATADKVRAERDLVEAQTEDTKERAKTHAPSIERMQQQVQESIANVGKIIQETATSASSAANIQQQTRNLEEIIPQIRATVEQLRAHTKLAGEQTKLAGAHTTLAGAQTGQAHAQTGLAKEHTSEVTQRIQANLPKVEAALKNLERIQRDMATPRLQADESTHEGYLGALSATIRALNPLNSFLNQR